MSKVNQLIVISGPTASGKTSLAIETAQKVNTEIISADSRQFYRELTIGTAKPSVEELRAVPHHFINSKSISEHYSAGDFEHDALSKIHELFVDHSQVVLVGGSGLYIQAVTQGFDQLPEVDFSIREELNHKYNELGIDYLVNELQSIDPSYAEQVDTSNPQRLIRALEVIKSSGRPFSELRKQNQENRPFDIHFYGINWERETLYERINQRVDIMMEQGLFEEVKSLYPLRELNALQTVGYQELFRAIEGELSVDEAVELIKRNTRRYAKRQLTWFKRIEDMRWLSPGEQIHVSEW